MKITISIILIFSLVIPFYGVFASADNVNISLEVTGEAPSYQCSDGIDNDSDGQIDYPDDPGCASGDDNDETNAPSGGGGGGGGAGTLPPSFLTTIVFKGKAYPGADVTLLKDAQVAAAEKADDFGNFEIILEGISGGIYTFGIWAQDTKGKRSITLSFTISVTAEATTTVSGIFIPPTIGLDKTVVKQGDILEIFGVSYPKSEVAIHVSSDEEKIFTATVEESGIYIYKLDTSGLAKDTHFAKSRSKHYLDDTRSSFSRVVSFVVGEESIEAEFLKGDLNGDGRVNLVDFSIAAFWYKRTISKEFAEKEAGYLNGDGKIDLVDFSIMAYFWTG